MCPSNGLLYGTLGNRPTYPVTTYNHATIQRASQLRVPDAPGKVPLQCVALILASLSATSFCEVPRGPKSTTIAVFDETRFPEVGGSPSLPPFKALEAIQSAGFDAVSVNALDLEDSTKFNAERYPVAVLWNGNAFPQNAAKNLRDFHAKGGCLILNGVPFTHPCEFTQGAWQDLGHREYFSHSTEGIGTGGFSGGKSAGTYEVAPALSQMPIHWLPRQSRTPQWFDSSHIHPGDRITPLVYFRTELGEVHNAATLIHHHCTQFAGSCDAWLGQVASGREETDRRLAKELLLRSLVCILREKKLLPAPAGAEDAWSAWVARINALSDKTPPAPIPSDVPHKDIPRPWGQTFLPKSKPPRRNLVAIDFRGLNAVEKVAVCCLQGLTSREDPHMWMLRQPLDKEWLEWHKTLGWIDGYELCGDWKSLAREAKQKGTLRGAVLYDTGLYRGDQIAINVAACEDALVVTPELANELHLPVLVDLRKRFTKYSDALRWFGSEYAGRHSIHLADFCAQHRILEATWAYAYQWRAPLVWGSGYLDERNPGADSFEDRRAIAELFSRMSPNSPVMGFPAGTPGEGLGEPPGVELASLYGLSLVCSDFLPNTPVTSGFEVSRLTQKKQPPAPTLTPDKIYVALALSDGDNLNAWLKFFRQYFDHPSLGTFPLAFGMGPAAREIIPGIARWYFDRATPLNEFICDVSGAGYMQPPKFGMCLNDPERAWKGFLDWTALLLPAMDMRTVRPVEAPNRDLERYARSLPFCHSIFSDMGRYSGHTGINQLTFQLSQGTPVFRAATTWKKNAGGPIAEIREQVGTSRPAFVNGFVHCWTFNPADIAAIVASAGDDIIFVTPSQLSSLYQQARNKGLTR